MKTLLLDSALSQFRDLFDVEAEFSHDMLTSGVVVRMTWTVSVEKLVASQNYSAVDALLAPIEAIRAADDRALIEAGTTPIVLGED